VSVGAVVGVLKPPLPEVDDVDPGLEVAEDDPVPEPLLAGVVTGLVVAAVAVPLASTTLSTAATAVAPAADQAVTVRTRRRANSRTTTRLRFEPFMSAKSARRSLETSEKVKKRK
jgi:hypothetical protein